MTAYAYNDDGWYAGTVEVDSPNSTTVEPPILSTTIIEGESRANWVRYSWRILPYAVSSRSVTQHYGFDSEGWYTGTVPVGSVNSTPIAPTIFSTDDTNGLPRSRWVGYVWVVETKEANTLRHVTKYAFKSRMTAAERITIRTAAQSSAVVYDFLDLADSATYIDLDLPSTRAGVQALEVAGLLAAGRAAEILDLPVQPSERLLNVTMFR